MGSVIKTTQMGQTGINFVLDRINTPDLKSAILSQLKEYDQIEAEAQKIAQKNNWNIPSLNPAVRLMSDTMTQIRLSFGNTDSTIAGMMIRGNMSGMIKGQKNLNHAPEDDGEVAALGQKLIQTEINNIRQMKPFL